MNKSHSRLPKSNCSRNRVLTSELSADGLVKFYHTLANDISVKSGVKLYLADDVFADSILYANFDTNNIKAILQAVIELNCHIHITFLNKKLQISNSLDIKIDELDLENIAYIRCYKRFYDSNKYLIHGARCSLVIDVWREKEAVFYGNFFNFLGVHLSADRFNQSFQDVKIGKLKVPTFKHFAIIRKKLAAEDPLDIVYTWVDSSDENWAARKAAVLNQTDEFNHHTNGLDQARFLNNSELLYSLRSVSYYMRGVRNIYIVTDQQIPDYLDLDHPKIRIIDHKEIFSNKNNIPSFNSNAIGSQLHHIAGLANKYLYFNDDVIMGRSSTRALFYDEYDRAKCFYSDSVAIPISRSDAYSAVDSAAGNNRETLKREFGKTIYRKFKHAPVATLKSVLFEMEARLAKAFTSTAAHRFRSADDHAVAGSLYLHYGTITGKVIPSSIEYKYFDTASDTAERRIRSLVVNNEKNRPDTYCVNAVFNSQASMHNNTVFNEVMGKIYPLKSQYEK